MTFISKLVGCVLALAALSSGARADNCLGGNFPTHGQDRIACTKFFILYGSLGGVRPYPIPGWEDVIWGVAPWEPDTKLITIREADINLVYWGGDNLSVFMGNSYQSDPVTPYWASKKEAGELRGLLNGQSVFPAGTGMQFPGANGEGDPTKTWHLDIHAWGPAGLGYFGYARVVYTVP